MDEVTIWHNRSCSKSRGAMDILAERGVEARVRDYLAEPPSEQELREVLELLGCRARDIVRTGEPEYAGLEEATDDQLIHAMTRHPVLIQRPIVVSGGRAVMGRPPERVIDLLGEQEPEGGASNP